MHTGYKCLVHKSIHFYARFYGGYKKSYSQKISEINSTMVNLTFCSKGLIYRKNIVQYKGLGTSLTQYLLNPLYFNIFYSNLIAYLEDMRKNSIAPLYMQGMGKIV